MSGKGDAPRPKTVDSAEFARNWERAFGKKPSDLGSVDWQKGETPSQPDAFIAHTGHLDEFYGPKKS